MTESFDNFQASDRPDPALAGRIAQFIAQFFIEFFQVQSLEQFLNGCRAHANAEFIAVHIEILAVFRFRQELLLRQRRIARIQDDIGGKIQYLFQRTGRNVEDQAHSAGNSLKIPNMRYGRSQFDMAHPFAANLCARYFNAAAVADNTFIANAFVFSAMAFPVFRRPENAFAE